MAYRVLWPFPTHVETRAEWTDRFEEMGNPTLAAFTDFQAEKPEICGDDVVSSGSGVLSEALLPHKALLCEAAKTPLRGFADVIAWSTPW